MGPHSRPLRASAKAASRLALLFGGPAVVTLGGPPSFVEFVLEGDKRGEARLGTEARPGLTSQRGK